MWLRFLPPPGETLFSSEMAAVKSCHYRQGEIVAIAELRSGARKGVSL